MQSRQNKLMNYITQLQNSSIFQCSSESQDRTLYSNDLWVLHIKSLQSQMAISTSTGTRGDSYSRKTAVIKENRLQFQFSGMSNRKIIPTRCLYLNFLIAKRCISNSFTFPDSESLSCTDSERKVLWSPQTAFQDCAWYTTTLHCDVSIWGKLQGNKTVQI